MKGIESCAGSGVFGTHKQATKKIDCGRKAILI
jgi:hypothetical protein